MGEMGCHLVVVAVLEGWCGGIGGAELGDWFVDWLGRGFGDVQCEMLHLSREIVAGMVAGGGGWCGFVIGDGTVGNDLGVALEIGPVVMVVVKIVGIGKWLTWLLPVLGGSEWG